MKNLEKYLPSVINEYEEIRGVYSAEIPEFEMYSDSITVAKGDLTILTSSEERIYATEQMLNCVPETVQDLNARRERLRMYLKNLPGYTLQSVISDITANCISGYCAYSIWFSDYRFSIDQADIPLNKWQLYYTKLKELIPCNFILTANNILSRQNRGTSYIGGAVSRIKTRRMGF